jgi:hypothetical protein
MGTRQLVAQHGLVDVGRLDAIRRDANLLEKGQPPRAGAGEDEAGARHYLLR